MSIPSRVLYVNLSDGSFRTESIDPTLPRALIGGYGINNRLAYDLIPPATDPLSPENLIIIGAGTFAGTLVPASAKVVITTRFPINGAFATAAGGGSFALFLKSVGYDHVIISGKASKPVYLRLNEERPELADSEELWGMDAYEADDALRNRHEPCSIIPIGPAGENLVRSSVTFVDKAGTIGRGGFPAVMGSKNLKAIVVQQGRVPVSVADRRTFHRLVNSLHDRIMRWPNRQLIQENGLIPAPPDMTDIHRKTRRPLACPSCPLADKVMVYLDEGEYAGVRTYMPHLSVNRFSAGSSSEAYQQSIKYSDTLNRYGIGGTNFSSMFASLVDLYQKGIITREDTGGIELKNDIETALKLVRMTAYRQGFGEVLAEGPVAIEQLVGERAIGSIAHIKGHAIVRDPRLGGLGTMEFEQLTTPRGAHVAAAGSPSYDSGRPPSDFIRHGQRMGVSKEALKRFEEAGVFNPGRYSKYSEDWYALFNCLSLCNRAQVNRFYHIDTIAAFYKAVTGINASPQELMWAAERAWTIGKLLNVREGFDRRYDRAPEAWFQPLVRAGEEHRMTDYDRTTNLTRKDLEGFLDDYYDERGYDRKSGLPTSEKLRELGLEHMAKDLDLPETV